MSAEERHLDELLGAYALDAVDDDERRAVEEWLAVDPAAAAEVAEYREIAAMLTFSPIAAPDAVWGRIADSIGDGAAPLPSGELAKVMPMSSAPSRARRRTTWAPWLAAAAAVAVAVFSVVAVSRESSRPPLEVAFEQALGSADSRVAVLTSDSSDVAAKAVLDTEGRGVIDTRSLPRLSDEQAYQLWGVNGDKVISLGVFGAEPGLEAFTATGEVSALAITIEVAGGVVSDGNPDGAYVGTLA